MSDGSNVKYQYLAGICANILTASYGSFCGWLSAASLELTADDSPLASGPLTSSEVGWIGSMLCMGGTVGTVFYAWCADRIGRKRSLQLSALPSLLGWLLIPFAQNPMHLAVSRFLGGFGGGGAFAVIPIYTTELATDSVRGTLGTFLILSCNFGILVAFLLGYFFNYITVAWILSLTSVIFIVSFSFMPETPQYLLRKNKDMRAQKSLMYYRGTVRKSAEHLQAEMEQLKGLNKDAHDSGSVTWKAFVNRQGRRGFLISIALMFLNQFSGCFVMINYTASIFHQSGSHMSPTSAAIVVGAIQLLGSYIATMLVDRAGRKILLIISSLGCGIGMLSLGLYVYLTKLGYNTTSLGWVPVASFSFAIFAACWGVLPLPYVVMAEILAPEIREIGSMICILLLWVISMFMLRFLPFMLTLLGMHGLMFSFAISCFVGAIFIIIFLPETKGKTIDAILALL